MNNCTIYVGTWNLSGVIDKIIDGILLQETDVVFIDNSSTDDTVAKIKARISDVRVIITNHSDIKRDNINEWHNIALADCKTEYIFLLDGDIFLPKDALNKANFAFNNEHIGGVAIQYGKQDHVQSGASLYKTDVIKGCMFTVVNTCTCRIIKNYLDTLSLSFIPLELEGVLHIKVPIGGRNKMEVTKQVNGLYTVTETVTRQVNKQMLEQQISGMEAQLTKMKAQLEAINKVQ
jgi:glycosyltransferase involved in cell wall biosynthesis